MFLPIYLNISFTMVYKWGGAVADGDIPLCGYTHRSALPLQGYERKMLISRCRCPSSSQWPSPGSSTRSEEGVWLHWLLREDDLPSSFSKQPEARIY